MRKHLNWLIEFTKKIAHHIKSPYVRVLKWLGLLLILLVAWQLIDYRQIISSLRQVSLFSISLLFAIMFTSKIIYALRWYWLAAYTLGLPGLSPWFILRTSLLAEFVSIAMPSSLGGEAVRLIKLTGRGGKIGRASISILLDRFIGIAGMTLIVIALLPQLGLYVDFPALIDKVKPYLPSLLLATTLCLAILSYLVWRNRQLTTLKHSLSLINQNIIAMCLYLLLTIVGHIIFAGAFYPLFYDVQPLPFLVVISLVLTSQLARSIPISVFGLSLSEGSLVALELIAGMKLEAAMAVMILSLLPRYFFALAGLGCEIWVDGREFIQSIKNREYPVKPSLE